MNTTSTHRFRAAFLGALSFTLGGAAALGNRLLDEPHWLAGAVGSGLVLGVALVVDAVRMGRAVEALGTTLKTEVEALHDRLDGIETRLSTRTTNAGSEKAPLPRP